MNVSKHNHNYSQYSNKPKPAAPAAPTVKMESAPAVVPQEPVRPIPVQETVETVTLPKTVTGTIAGCAKLNVRSDASLFADVVCTLDVMSEIMIDVDKSTKDWLYICTATGIEGYCMRKFVDAHL